MEKMKKIRERLDNTSVALKKVIIDLLDADARGKDNTSISESKHKLIPN